MGRAKQIVLKPVSAAVANALVRRVHYSGKVQPNSQMHFGVFLNGQLEGALQFGPSMDKRRMVNLVAGTQFNGFVELNRMAFSEALPRNSESRALGVAMRLLRRHRPGLEWVVSFADGTQCGDGTIYRAAGFVLTQIKRNASMVRMPNGDVVARKTLDNYRCAGGRYGSAVARDMGAVPLAGFQLRYVYFLNPAARSRLTCPEIPYSAIREAGAQMYRGARPGDDDDAVEAE